LNSEKRKLFEHCPGGQCLDDGTVYNVPEIPQHERKKNFLFKRGGKNRTKIHTLTH
jgi:hypothetical protein